MAEVPAAELGADAEGPRHLQHRLLHLAVAECTPLLGPVGRQIVQLPAARELQGLHGHFRREPADHDGEVIRGARGRADRPDRFLQELEEAAGAHDRRHRLVEKGLVGGPPALGDEQELERIAVIGMQVDLRGQIGAGVDLLVHRERGQLAVAEVGLRVGPVDAPGKGLAVVAAGPDLLPLVPDHDRGAGVLAHGEDATRRGVRVLEERQRDVAIIRRRLRVIENGPQLRKVGRT